jgi:hypothetical protein
VLSERTPYPVEPRALAGFVSRCAACTHVFGIAFPCTEIDGTRDAEMERSFLRLAYAVTRLTCIGSPARGYFVVLRQELRDTARRLQARYEVAESVHIIFASLLVAEMTRLSDAAEAVSGGGDQATLHDVAHQIALEALRREVASREAAAVEQPASQGYPFGVPWDYYGCVRGDAGVGASDRAPANQPF